MANSLAEIRSSLEEASKQTRKLRCDLLGGEQVAWLDNLVAKIDDGLTVLDKVEELQHGNTN